MKRNEVTIGCVYTAKVSDRLVPVRIDSAHSNGGWNATSTKTGKRIRIKSAQRLSGAADDKQAKTTEPASAEKAASPANAVGKPKADVAKGKKATSKKATTKKAKAKKTGAKKPKRVSALDAAAKVLAKAEKPNSWMDRPTASTAASLARGFFSYGVISANGRNSIFMA